MSIKDYELCQDVFNAIRSFKEPHPSVKQILNHPMIRAKNITSIQLYKAFDLLVESRLIEIVEFYTGHPEKIKLTPDGHNITDDMGGVREHHRKKKLLDSLEKTDIKTKRAVESLLAQREKLDNNEIYITNVWDMQTREMIKKYFGADSDFYRDIQSKSVYFAFSRKAVEERDLGILVRSAFSKMFIDGCIEYLLAHGTYEPPPQPTVISENISHSIVNKGDNITQSGAFESGIRKDSNSAVNSLTTNPTPAPNTKSPTRTIQRWQLVVGIIGIITAIVLAILKSKGVL